MNKKVIIIVGVVLAISGIIGFNIFNTNRIQAAEGGVARNAPPVQWIHPETQTIISRVSARGNVELRDRTIVFPDTQAQIVQVHVSVGDIVNVGDLLITYDERTLDTLNDNLAEARLALRQAELGLAQARVAPSDTEILSAETQIEQARNNIANIESQIEQADLQISQLRDNITTAQNTQNDVQMLFNSGVATRTELDNAIDAVRRLEDQLAIAQSQRDATVNSLGFAQDSERLAQAQYSAVRGRNTQPAAVNQAQIQQVSIEQAQLRIAQIERNIADFEHEERATASGTVLAVFVEEGEMSVSGRPLMEIADISNDNLVVVAHVPENDAGGITTGQNVQISGGALGGHTYEGYIELIHPLAAPRQMGTTMETVVTVEIAPRNAERLRAGYTVDADIVTNVNEGTIVVPLMATRNAGGGENYVLVIDQNSYLERRDVTLGEFSDMFIEVTGLTGTEMVVSNPAPNLHPGMQVRVITPQGGNDE